MKMFEVEVDLGDDLVVGGLSVFRSRDRMIPDRPT